MAIDKESTMLYDTLHDKIVEVANDQIKLNQIKKAMIYVHDKNIDILNTNIVGESLLINEKDQNNILEPFGYTKAELIDICKKSPRLNGADKILDQFAFALPLLLLAGQLKQSKDQKLQAFSQTVFLFTYYRAYASKVKVYFTYGTVDEKAMEYTTMIELNDKSYIHKYGSVYNVLVQSAKPAYDLYINSLGGKPNIPTDDFIFNNVFYSAIFSKTGSWINSLYDSYKKVKASGKYLDYEKSMYSSVDKDDNVNYAENNINSNSAAKKEIVQKAVTKFNMAPIDNKLITAAAGLGYQISEANGGSKLGSNNLIQIVNCIAETKSSIIPTFFDAIVGAYLDSMDDMGNRNSAKDIPSVKFFAYSKKIIKTSHTININIREEQNILHDLITSCSDRYANMGSATKVKMENTLYYYFILFIQQANK